MVPAKNLSALFLLQIAGTLIGALTESCLDARKRWLVAAFRTFL